MKNAYVIVCDDVFNLKQTMIQTAESAEAAIEIAKDIQNTLVKKNDPIIIEVWCYSAKEEEDIPDPNKYLFLYHEIYPENDSDIELVDEFTDEPTETPHRSDKHITKFKIGLLDALKILSIDNYTDYLIPISTGLEYRANELDDKILSLDNPSEKLEQSFDDLCEIIDEIDRLYNDAEKENSKDKIQELISYMKSEIADYQKYYGGLKSIKI